MQQIYYKIEFNDENPSYINVLSHKQTKYNLPSWCDRVLRKSYPMVHVVCNSYG